MFDELNTNIRPGCFKNDILDLIGLSLLFNMISDLIDKMKLCTSIFLHMKRKMFVLISYTKCSHSNTLSLGQLKMFGSSSSYKHDKRHVNLYLWTFYWVDDVGLSAYVNVSQILWMSCCTYHSNVYAFVSVIQLDMKMRSFLALGY